MANPVMGFLQLLFCSKERSELRQATQKIKLLEGHVAQLEEPEDPGPQGFPIYEMAWDELVAELAAAGIEWMHKKKFPPDYKLLYTDIGIAMQMVPFLTFSGEYYVAEGADCDKYSKMAAATMSFKFKLNSCLECWGPAPVGPHAFGLLVGRSSISSSGGVRDYRLFEPNAGFKIAGIAFRNGENGYTAQSWK